MSSPHRERKPRAAFSSPPDKRSQGPVSFLRRLLGHVSPQPKTAKKALQKSPARGLPPNLRSVFEYRNAIFRETGQVGPARFRMPKPHKGGATRRNNYNIFKNNGNKRTQRNKAIA